MDKLAEKTFSYGTVEKALTVVFGVRGEEGMFRARLKNLRALGLPGNGPGRGTAHSYRQLEIDELLIALHLELQIGIPPSGAIQFIKSIEERLAKYLRRARAAERGDECIIVGRKSPQWGAGGVAPIDIIGSFPLDPKTPEKLPDLWKFLKRGETGSVINLSELLRRLDRELWGAACRIHVARSSAA